MQQETPSSLEAASPPPKPWRTDAPREGEGWHPLAPLNSNPFTHKVTQPFHRKLWSAAREDESNLWETWAQKEEGKIRDTSQEARMEDTSLVVR